MSSPLQPDEADLAWWTRQLGSPLPLLQLASDRPRPRVLASDPGALDWRGGELLGRALESLARQRGLEASAVLLAAYAVLLSRHSGQDDLVIGVAAPPAGQLDVLCFRCDLSGKPSFAELAQRLQAARTEMLAHRAVSFAHLAEALAPRPEPGSAPVFQAGFELAEGALADASPAPRADVALRLVRTPAALTGRFEYSRDLFDPATIERLADGYRALLEHALRNPETAIDRLPVMTPDERQRQLSACGPLRPYDPARTVVHRIDEQVRRRGATPAVHHAGGVLSYAELGAQTAVVAHRLRELGAGPGAAVAIHLDRGPHLIVALLATLRVGAHYVPLDPRHPVERNARILAQARPAVVVVETALAGALPPAADARVLPLDAATPLRGPRDTSPIAASPDGLAYVIFTSGSTGEPKGVEITHAALVNLLTSMAIEPGLAEGDHLLALTTISFDIAGLELWLPLMVGASLEIAPAGTANDPLLMIAALAARPPTLLQATPSSFQLLVDAGWKGQERLTLLCGGEPLPPRLAAELGARCRRLFNVYGPTETTIWSSLDAVDRADPLITIGRPLQNTRLYVLDAALEPVPQGVPGELCIGGDGVARGYHGRPDLTAERFLPDPFAGAPGARLYRTGDLARRLADGRFQHLGRSDFQIKLRGHRIELGEIEAAMLAHPEVERAVAHVHEASPGDRRLVGYVQTRERTERVPADLAARLRERLPSYMRPWALVAVRAMPLTPNGKIDRRALPTPRPSQAGERDRTGPRNDVEVKIAAVWQALLGVPLPDVADDFFVSGGNSLLAVRLIQELNRAFGIELPVAPFFEHPTIGALAVQIRRGGGVLESSVLPLVRGTRGTPLYFVCGIHIYQTLAEKLGEDQPSFGVFIPAEQRLFDPDSRSSGEDATVEELARAYVETLIAFQPTGPCALAGVSFGGVLAFEVARQLVAAGREVQTLVLIDSILPGCLRRNHLRWLAHQWRHAREHGVGGLVDKALARITRRFVQDVRGPQTQSVAEQEVAILGARRQQIYSDLTYDFDSRPATYDGHTILIRASESAMVGFDVAPDLGWRERVRSELRIYEVPGDHLGVLSEPDVSVTAEILRHELMGLRSPLPAGSTQARR